MERSILIRLGRSVAEEAANTRIIDDSGLECSDLRKFIPCYECCSDPDEDSVTSRKKQSETIYLDSWLLIEHTDSGLKLSEIYADNCDGYYRRESSFCLTDSSLYVFERRNQNMAMKKYPESSHIHRLEIRNPANGWETSDISGSNFCCIHRPNSKTVAVLGEYIYAYDYVYNTRAQDGFFISDPPNSEFRSQIWIPLEGRGMLIADLHSDPQFYLHDPNLNRWNLCEDYQKLPEMKNVQYSVLDGMLYCFDRYSSRSFVMYAYNCYRGKLHYRVIIPKLLKNVPRQLREVYYCPWFIVAVSHSKFCFMWQNALYGLFCAEVLVSGDDLDNHNPSVEILGVRWFDIDGCEIDNVMPVDANLGKIAKKYAISR